MKSPTVYGIPNCDSVKKARAWLTEQGIAYQFHDFKKQGVPEAELGQWLSQCGWEVVLNRKGTTWRQLAPEVQAQVLDAASARRLMLAQASVIKRPVIAWPSGTVTVGYTPQRWPA